MTRSGRRRVILVTAAALVVAAALTGLVAGCGSGGATTTAATTVTTNAATTVTTESTSYTTHYAPGQSPTTTTASPTTTTAPPPTTTTTYVPKTVSVDVSANGGVVDLNLRDKIKLTLVGNPTTGFNWAIAAPQVSVVIIRPMGEPDYQAGSGVGQGGTYTWMFESIAQGQSPLVLEYRSPGQALAAKTFSVTVNVDYVLVSERQAGSSINIQQGDVLGIQLAGDPSTGYGWAVTAIDQAKLRQAADPDYQALTGQTGAGGTYTFRFQTYGQGSTVLKLDYLSSGGGVPGKSFQITVNVQ